MGAVQLGELQTESKESVLTTPQAAPAGFIGKLFATMALLLPRPMTAAELIEATGYKPDTIYNYILRGREHGVIYIIDFVDVDGVRAPQARYAVQPKRPFGMADAKLKSSGVEA
jgi:hypothetical protein